MQKRRRHFLPFLLLPASLLLLLLFHLSHYFFRHTSKCEPRLLIDSPNILPYSTLQTSLQSHFQDQLVIICGPPDGCPDLLHKICNQTHQLPAAVAGYLSTTPSTVNCLRQMGFYSAVAVRTPLERWSAEYAQRRRAVSYLEFMANYNDCSLLHYFDAKGAVCADDDDVGERVQSIVQRFDTAFDPYEAKGKLAQLIGKLRKGEKSFRAFLAVRKLKGEERLYSAALGRTTQRSFC